MTITPRAMDADSGAGPDAHIPLPPARLQQMRWYVDGLRAAGVFLDQIKAELDRIERGEGART